MEQEIWKPVKGYEKKYEISNIGSVRSLTRIITRKNTNKTYTSLGQPISARLKNKTLSVKLGSHNNSHQHSVARLVFLTFCHTDLDYFHVRFKDKSKGIFPDNLYAYKVSKDYSVRIDLLGIKFGELNVISQNNSTKLWVCVCSCGKIIETSTQSLRNGSITKCGYKCTTNLSRRIIVESKKIWNVYRLGAERRGIGFNLSVEDFNLFIKNDCFYCGNKPLNVSPLKVSGGVLIWNGIDRINSDKEYELGNCVSCCKYCNYAKQAFTLKEWTEWLQRVVKNIPKIKLLARGNRELSL